ncbi:MAG: alcohol dehydrogenase catalytic domain-containing protein [Spirochaetota bacterium]
MKAAVIKKPGLIKIEQVPTTQPAEGEVLLKVEACALCGTDQRVLKGEKSVDVHIVGHEITARVAAAGQGVKGVQEGERYVVQTVIGCGRCRMCKMHRENLCLNKFKAIGYQYNGGFAEYMVMPKEGVVQGCLIPVPEDLSAEVGTLIEPLSCCVNGMNYIPLEEIEHVVIFGGGIIGVLNGLVAKARGAECVTIMDISPQRLELLQRLSLPFENFVDTSQTDPHQWVMEHTQGHGAGAVVVAASVKQLVPTGMRLLTKGGHLSVFAGMPKSDPTEYIDLNLIHYNEFNLHGATSSALNEYITARDLLVSGKINGEQLVTHRFNLDEFHQAFQVQSDASSGALKVIIIP